MTVYCDKVQTGMPVIKFDLYLISFSNKRAGMSSLFESAFILLFYENSQSRVQWIMHVKFLQIQCRNWSLVSLWIIPCCSKSKDLPKSKEIVPIVNTNMTHILKIMWQRKMIKIFMRCLSSDYKNVLVTS